MILKFPDIKNLKYKSLSQRIRVTGEQWLMNEMYCPACGNDILLRFPNNTKLADFFCGKCNAIYKLKSKRNRIGKSILDGAYFSAIERITGSTNPNLFVLQYCENIIVNLTLVPKYFFTPDVLKMRNALSSDARRAGYIGSFILYDKIPLQGKIKIIESNQEINKNIVLENYRRALNLKIENINLRGWLMDILKCIDKIGNEIFLIQDIYFFEDELARKHPENCNIKAKIRQQLQFLRDKGFIEFLGNGKYKNFLRR